MSAFRFRKTSISDQGDVGPVALTGAAAASWRSSSLSCSLVCYLRPRGCLPHLQLTRTAYSCSFGSAALCVYYPHYFDKQAYKLFDEGGFLLLFQVLMRRRPAEARNIQIEADFAAVIQKTKTDAAYRRACDSKFFIQWGYSKQPGVGQQYIDDILQTPVATIPKVMTDTAFSIMAWEANICVNKISGFAEHWIGIVPKLLQSEYLDPLRKVQRVATAFTLLENQESRLKLSDLDTFLDCVRIASHLSDGKDTAEADTEADDMASKLEAARLKGASILDYVLGFTGSLDSAQSLDASAYNFGKFKSWWELNQLNWRSRKVTAESVEWDSVRDAVTEYRTKELLVGLESRARSFAKDFTLRENERVSKRRAELSSTPSAGYLDWATISGWSQSWMYNFFDARKIFLKIDVDDPKRSVYTYANKRTEDYSWTFSQTEAFRIHLLPTSMITVSVLYADPKKPKGILKHVNMYGRRLRKKLVD